MKKVLYFIASVAVLASAFACKPDDKDKIDDQTGTKTRISQLRDKWDWWDFVYNADGKIEKIDRCNGKRVWNFAWSGTQCNVTGQDTFDFTIGNNGKIATLNWKDNSVYTFTYDADGHMTESKKDGTVIATIEITAGNITKITEGENVFTYVYGSEPNVLGIQYQYNDSDNIMVPKWYRFLVESGLYGAPSKNIPTSCSLNGVKMYDYQFESKTPTEEGDGFIVGKEYVLMNTKNAEGEAAVHYFLFEEYK